MPNKIEVARSLALAHHAMEPTIQRVVRMEVLSAETRDSLVATVIPVSRRAPSIPLALRRPPAGRQTGS
jgi:hypothetical protein